MQISINTSNVIKLILMSRQPRNYKGDKPHLHSSILTQALGSKAMWIFGLIVDQYTSVFVLNTLGESKHGAAKRHEAYQCQQGQQQRRQY